ncbi:MAG: hypothetical protein QOH10_1847 [Actinomycetota bacterium]|nr:hypothetical protein [Actinomycetota bacterium]
MTDVLDRGEISPSVEDVRAIVVRRPRFDLGADTRVFLAAASAGAGAIHLAMVPAHWAESIPEGLGFAICGWLQLAFAAFVLTRPSRALLRFGIVLNLAAIAAWIVSRTAGLPFGPNSGHAEIAGFVDITCVAFEGALVVACAVLLVRPLLTARFARGGLAFAGIAGLGVLALTTAALASPGARNHAAHSHGGAAAGAGAAHTHGSGAGTAAGHTHGTPAAADDKGFSLLHNGQHAHSTMLHVLDAATSKALAAQLAVTREVARKTPTVADALKAGYQRVGPYFPGIGAHYMKAIGKPGGGFNATTLNFDGVVDDNDLRNPLMVIFDGTKPTSKVAGFMYYSMAPYEPAGFIGRNDTWHFHEQLCLKYTPQGIDVPYGLDNSATEAQCAKVGGIMLKASQYMLHVWSVPGYEMSAQDGGVFGEANPKLACADGTYYELPLPEWASHPLNVCKAQ